MIVCSFSIIGYILACIIVDVVECSLGRTGENRERDAFWKNWTRLLHNWARHKRQLFMLSIFWCNMSSFFWIFDLFNNKKAGLVSAPLRKRHCHDCCLASTEFVVLCKVFESAVVFWFLFSINALYQKIRDIHTISIDCLVFDYLFSSVLIFLCRYHCSLLVGDAWSLL